MTRQITCKQNVRLNQLTPAFVYGMLALQTMLLDQSCPDDGIVVTSLNDSTHGPTSRHYTGEAWDLRVHNFGSDQQVRAFQALYLARLGPQFTILYESPETMHAHLHCQVALGRAFQWDPDRETALARLLQLLP
jgi:hypothetical protein